MATALAVFKRNAQELRRSNVELEKLAYVAAHDLRSPLRAIQDLCAWISEDDDNALSLESKVYLSMVLSRTNRPSKLLADLLDCARAGQDNPEPQEVALPMTVAQMALTLDPDRSFNIVYIGPEERVWCYHTALTQILRI